MKLLSVNVGLPREVEWNARTIRTSIFKAPVPGRVPVRKLNLDGDEQSDLTVHGGVDKAVYVYPSEHYAFWRDELPGADLHWGAFGENFTTEGSTTKPFTLVIGFASARRSSLLPNLACHASSSVFASGAQI